MRVLGVDIGLKRTGLAISDELGISVKMLPNLSVKTQKLALEKILFLIKDFSVTVVVIGMPLPKTTGSIAIASRANALKHKLDEALSGLGLTVETHLVDETMTSKRAMTQLVASNVPQRKRRALLDGASAAILVEDFLTAWKHG